MHPFIRKTGEFVGVKYVNLEQVRVGDIILYFYKNKLFTHRVVMKQRRGNKLFLIPKGDRLPFYEFPVGEESFIGKVIWVLRGEKVVKFETPFYLLFNYFIAWLSRVSARPRCLRERSF
jgi:signal peptidase I